MSFQALAQCLNPGERLRLELAVEGENLTVLVHPVLKTAPDHLSDEPMRLRAALAHPLRLSAPASDLDVTLLESLKTYGEKRRALQSSASELESLDEALRQAQQAAHGKRQKVAKTTQAGTTPASKADEATAATAPSASARPPAPSAAVNTNPESLF